MYSAAQINATAIQMGIDPNYVLTPEDRIDIARLMVESYNASQVAFQVSILKSDSDSIKSIATASLGINEATTAWEQKIPPLAPSQNSVQPPAPSAAA